MGIYFLHADGRWSNHYPFNSEAPDYTPEEGGQWVEGEPTGDLWGPPPPFNLADTIRDVFKTLPPASQYKFKDDVSAGYLAIQQDNPALLVYILGVCQSKIETPEELAAFQQIQALVEGAS